MRMLTLSLSGKMHGFVRRGLSAGLGVVLVLGTLVWAQLDLDRMRSLAQQRYGPEAVALVDDWHRTIEAMRGMPEPDKLASANDFFNPPHLNDNNGSHRRPK